MESLLKDLQYATKEDLYHGIGIGNQVAVMVAKKLVNSDDGAPIEQKAQSLAIRGTEEMIVKYAQCCCPIPGDPIVGCLQTGRGITIHIDHCSQVDNFRNELGKLINLRWDDSIEGEYLASISVAARNQRGVLANLAAAICDAEANIDNISVEPRDGYYNTINLKLSVKNRVHLARVLRRVRANNNDIIRINRTKK